MPTDCNCRSARRTYVGAAVVGAAVGVLMAFVGSAVVDAAVGVLMAFVGAALVGATVGVLMVSVGAVGDSVRRSSLVNEEQVHIGRRF